MTKAYMCVFRARDQGFTRPTVLLLTPFRHSAKQAVEKLLSLLPGVNEITNKKRFEEEFGGDDDKDLHAKPDDFREIFSGNTDDCFRIGLAFLRKTTKLYAPFYKADIIVASPLGLKLIIGDEGFVSALVVCLAVSLTCFFFLLFCFLFVCTQRSRPRF